MGVELVLRHFDHGYRDVGAVVRDALVGGEQVIQHEAVLDGAGAGLQAGDVAGLDLAHQAVHHFFQGLDLARRVAVTLLEGIHRAVDDVLYRRFQHGQVGQGFVAEADVLVPDLLRGLDEVHGVIGDAFKVADGMQQGVDGAVVLFAQGAAGQLHQVGAQNVLVMVDGVFLAADFIGNGIVPFAGGGHGLQQGSAADLSHIAAHQHGTVDGHGGGGEQTLVQQGVLLRFLAVRHGEDGQTDQQLVEGQQDSGGHHVEDGVDDGNVEGGGLVVIEGEMEHGVQGIEPAQEHRGADDVEVQVDHGGAAGVLVGTGGGDQRGDTGADVLAHDDGHGCRHGHYAGGGGQRLQDTHGGGGGLDDGGEQSAHQHAQNGVGEGQEQLAKPGRVGQGRGGAGHQIHASHEDGEAQEDLAHALFTVLAEHEHDNAHKAQQGAPGIGAEHLDKEALALQTGQAQQPGGHGGAHVSAHDDAHRLVQVHQAGVHETNDHDGGGGGGLDHGGDRQAQQKTAQGRGGHLAQNDLQLAAGGLLQVLAHDVHAVEEHGKAAKEDEDVENTHTGSTSILLYGGKIPAFPL